MSQNRIQVNKSEALNKDIYVALHQFNIISYIKQYRATQNNIICIENVTRRIEIDTIHIRSSYFSVKYRGTEKSLRKKNSERMND